MEYTVIVKDEVMDPVFRVLLSGISKEACFLAAKFAKAAFDHTRVVDQDELFAMKAQGLIADETGHC